MPRDKILTILTRHEGEIVSGNELAKAAEMSRTAVWKRIITLKEQGYEIESIPSHGYILHSTKLCKIAITEALGNTKLINEVIIEKEVDSTNTRLKVLAMNGAPAGTLMIAESQSGGRGRLGRSFYSSKGAGLYMSLLLRPDYRSDVSIATVCAAVAVVNALEELTNLRPRIKWVNDIYIGSKKVCGILAEGGFEAQSSVLSYLVIGIGINLKRDKNRPLQLEGIMTSLSEEGFDICVNQLAATVLIHLEKVLDKSITPQGLQELLHCYREHMLALGEDVLVLDPSGEFTAKVMDITSTGALKVQKANGEIVNISSGEISIRPCLG